MPRRPPRVRWKTSRTCFCPEDGGLVWRAIDTPDMPDVAYHAAVFETHEPYRLFVANDGGVWMTEDFASWIDISTTLPNAIVSGPRVPPSRPQSDRRDVRTAAFGACFSSRSGPFGIR